ncbi:MAG: pantoate--beta-alanine ligase [Armatimonadetes bacterium]|nr:pantoate--beta-alanine ligase [Armatimonadota bacterium]NOG92576.1 pantoate--beta-alanine ligase [Armatimonadota bacterium]
MKVVRTAVELSDAIGRNESVHFVPTMGYLHDGHLSLIRAAGRDANAGRPKGVVVVSSFVNPTQFNDPRDLEAYPRDEARDIELARSAHCDVFFAPDVDTIYREGLSGTRVHVPGVSERWEGEFRPGHFDGVATVVAKLFHLVVPTVAYFGEKDWQQCRVIAKMVDDLDFPLSLKFCETVREPDGLAMSSRNARLRPEVRAKAPALYETIREGARAAAAGGDLRTIEQGAEHALRVAGFEKVDYFAIVNERTLERTDSPTAGTRVIAAAWIGGVRLIDNVEVPV